MNEFQLSSIANSQTCQNCGFCCSNLIFWMTDTEDLKKRFKFLDSELIKVTDTNIVSNGNPLFVVTINIKCIHLNATEGYCCSIWEEDEKPLTCRLYPSNLFVNYIQKQKLSDNIRINQLLEVNGVFCPLLQNINIDNIIDDQIHLFEK